MNTRYIPRFRLPERQYTAGAPVVLAAGALLEDTKVPRLVAQLKLKSISAKPIAALAITLHCLDRDGMGAGAVSFSYESLSILRGQAFGQYTAIVLPGDRIRSFSVTVHAAVFGDGTIWTAQERAMWDSLSGFTPLEHAVRDPALLALSREGLPQGRYAYSAPADLWYCTCGGVNHADEAACHRCQTPRSLAAQYTRSGPLAALLQTRQDEAARREVERKEAAQETARQEAMRVAAAQQAALRSQPSDEAPVSAGEAAVKPKRPGKNTLLAAVAGLAAVAAIVVLLPKFTGESTVPHSDGPSTLAASPSPSGSTAAPAQDPRRTAETIHVTTPSDRGETAFMEVQEDANGLCTVSTDTVTACFPEVQFFSGSAAPLGNDIDDYLMDSFHMAFRLSIGTREWGYDRSDFVPKNFYALLLYDEQAHLCGYAIGMPEERGGGVWRLNITLCDYDFTPLVEAQTAAYYASADTFGEMPYVPPGDVYGCGSAWVVRGFNMGKKDGAHRHCQMYHLWSRLNSPYLERCCQKMEAVQTPSGDGNTVRYTYYLLLDEAYEPIGYTMLSSGDSATGPSDSAEAKPLHITTPSDQETVYIDLTMDSNGSCRITLAELQEQFPQVESLGFEGVPRMGGSIDVYLQDSFQMAVLVGTRGQEGSDDTSASFSPLTDPDSPRALLLFDGKTHLMGHAIGVPEALGDGVWRLYLTLCDYDFTPLFEAQMAAYYASEEIPYLAPADVDGCGAAWFLYGYHIRKDDEALGHCQMYHLWNQLTSPYLERHSRDIEALERRLPRGDTQNPDYVYYLLLDEAYELIGYTMLNSAGSTAPPAV